MAGFDLNGNKVIAGNPGPGVNPITFSDDDRLFVAPMLFDNKFLNWILAEQIPQEQYSMN